MLAKLRNFMVTCAGAFVAFAVGIPLFILVFLSPTFVTRSDIMILAGWFMWIPAFAIAGPVGYALGKAVIGWLGGKPDGHSHGVARNIGLGLVGLAFVWTVHVFQNGYHDKNFTLTWQEPVRADDGAVIQVQRTRRFRRPDLALHKYSDAVYEGEELSFDSGAPAGRVKLVTQLHLVYLGRIAGVWYAVLGPHSHRQEDGTWGKEFNIRGQRLAVLKDGRFQPAPWSQAPAAIVMHNLLGESVTVAEQAQFQTQPPDLQTKQALFRRSLQQHPRPDAFRIARPKGADHFEKDYREALKSL